MKSARSKAFVMAVILLCVQSGWAAEAPERLAAIKARMERVKAIAQRLPERKKKALSSGLRNLVRLAERWDQIEPGLRQAAQKFDLKQGAFPSWNLGEESLRSRTRAALKVSNPSTDLFFSSFSGFTQNETSTAWCGSNVVIGFNDSGSFFESFFSGPGGLSFNGYARSTNGGSSFTDLGFLNPGPVTTDFLAGDPVVACADATTFFYASVFLRDGTSDISVSKSTNGGLTFDDPVSAVSKSCADPSDPSNCAHFVEKPWIAVDPTNTSRIYVTYTDFDESGTSGACGSDPRTAIELVRSTNGGTSWDAPVVIVERCGDAFVQGSQVVVGPSGEVYVAWEEFEDDFTTRAINIRKSTNSGVSFGAAVKVDDVICVGSCGGFGVFDDLLQGAFRSSFELPSLAVDRSGTAMNGSLYVAWHDARNLNVFDALTGYYGYADVLVSRSTDGGATWSTPVRVNSNIEPLLSGLGTDQYQPGIAVNKAGKIGVCFYDRRNDSNNFLIDRYCATSTTAGASWTNKRITSKNFAAVPGQDVLLVFDYMGDYDTVASDFTKVNSGLIGAWGDNSKGNPDVQAAKF